MSELRALYCHIPFCHSICPFCAFAVHGNQPKLHTSFVEALQKEISHQSEIYGGKDHPIESVYFGGGTPSALSIQNTATLLTTIQKYFSLAPDCEIAFETNPEDISPGYVSELYTLGIRRLSLGIQSFSQPTLTRLGRGHTAQKAKEAANTIAESLFMNFNLDILYGVPGDDTERLQSDLETVLEYDPPHISLYGLDVEPGTLFGRDPKIIQETAANQDKTVQQYVSAVNFLSSHGLEGYETSNFCKPGMEGRQNTLTWDGAEYLGFGPGAHSFVSGQRFYNHRHLKAYQRSIQKDHTAVEYSEIPTSEQRANEVMMIQLRRTSGLDIKQWSLQWGVPWDELRCKIVDDLVGAELAIFSKGCLALTPKGRMMGDAITAQLMV